MFNAIFLPIIYFLYPETGKASWKVFFFNTNYVQANRTLEDVDAYYRSNPPLVVVGDPDATSTKRPLRFIQHEDEEIQRKAKQANSSNLKDSEVAGVEYVD